MTTVAYRAGILAADARATIGDTIIPGTTDKITVFKDGSAAAFCGRFSSGLVLSRWLADVCAGEQAGPMPAYEECTLIHCSPKDGVLIYENNADPFPLEAEFFAMGSGTEAALGALYVGATAPEAVTAATNVDIYSGPPVKFVEIPGLVPQPKTTKSRKR